MSPKKILDRFISYINKLDSLEKQIFWLTLIIADIACLASAFITFGEHLGILATIFSFVCFGFLAMLTVYAVLMKSDSVTFPHFILCSALNFLLLPILYFTCGGIHCGMMMYFLTAIFLTSLCKKGKPRNTLFILSTIILGGCIAVDFAFPDIKVDITKNGTDFAATYTDDLITFIINAIVIFILSCRAINAYDSERTKSEKLLEKVKYFSNHDDLTGLYNRRVFFTYLEDTILNDTSEYYIAMYDIDNFKSVNDNYGHQFGDTVLSDVSGAISDSVRKNEGEIAARYGGEEFIYIIHASKKNEAFERADNIRKAVEALSFSENEGFRVTISGGITKCEKNSKSAVIVKKADDMLYYSKHHGKNRVTASWNTNS